MFGPVAHAAAFGSSATEAAAVVILAASGGPRHEIQEDEEARPGPPEALMRVTAKIVNPGSFRKILHPFPRRGTVDLHIEASAPIDIYIIDAGELSAFRAGRPVGGFTFASRIALDRRVDLLSRLEGDNDWYLILDNLGNQPVAVHYEVYC